MKGQMFRRVVGRGWGMATCGIHPTNFNVLNGHPTPRHIGGCSVKLPKEHVVHHHNSVGSVIVGQEVDNVVVSIVKSRNSHRRGIQVIDSIL